MQHTIDASYKLFHSHIACVLLLILLTTAAVSAQTFRAEAFVLTEMVG